MGKAEVIHKSPYSTSKWIVAEYGEQISLYPYYGGGTYGHGLLFTDYPIDAIAELLDPETAIVRVNAFPIECERQWGEDVEVSRRRWNTSDLDRIQ